ncbi:MAG: hypothetical protein AB7P49_00040 [Bdellovibrionales bacterium]
MGSISGGYNVGTGEVGNSGMRVNAVFSPLNRLRTAGHAGGIGERVPVGGGNVGSATQAGVAFSIHYSPGVERDAQNPEYPVVTQALDSLPLTLPNGVSLADAAEVVGLFGYGLAPGSKQASLRVQDRATVFVDSSVAAGQILYAKFPEEGDELATFPKAENGVFVPKILARDRLGGSEDIFNTLSRAVQASSAPPAVTAALEEFKKGLMSACYTMTARVLASLEGSAVGSTEDADRVLASASFQASERGKVLKDLAGALGIEGRAETVSSQILEATFKEMCSKTPSRQSSNPLFDGAKQMAVPQIVNGVSYMKDHTNRHNLGVSTSNVSVAPGTRGKCEMLLSCS